MTVSRIAALAALLTGCQRVVPDVPPALPHIPCAHAGEALAPACTYDRTGATILIRHPDGAFRRFRIADGTLATDGAVRPVITRSGNTALVEVDGDRYELPAR